MKRTIKEIVENVFNQNPRIMIPNIVQNVFAFTRKVKAKLEESGYAVAFVGKTKGEGQFCPPDFEPRFYKDAYLTGVSHDALYIDDAQYDLVGAGNDSDEPIRDVATPTANEIPQEKWRATNPPVQLRANGQAGPTLPPAPKNKPYIGDAFWQKVGDQLVQDYGDYNQRLNAGALVWIGRLSHTINVENMQPDVAVAKHRAEWLAILRG